MYFLNREKVAPEYTPLNPPPTKAEGRANMFIEKHI